MTRRDLLELARTAGWPRLRRKLGEATIVGPRAWVDFVRRSNTRDLTAALQQLRLIELHTRRQQRDPWTKRS